MGAAVAERLRHAIEDARGAEWPAGLRVTASLGLSVLHPTTNFEEAVRCADHARYRAKADGRNAVRLEVT